MPLNSSMRWTVSLSGRLDGFRRHTGRGLLDELEGCSEVEGEEEAAEDEVEADEKDDSGMCCGADEMTERLIGRG